MQTATYPDYVNYLLSLGYEGSVKYLLEKYGQASLPYFEKDSYEDFLNGKVAAPAKNRVTRTIDGLYCHHVREDKGILLSTPKAIKAFQYPYEWQLPENLVYCTLLEHLVLHAMIAIEQKDASDQMRLGIGGYVNFMRPELISWFVQGNIPTIPWQRNCYNAISDMTIEDFRIIILRLDRLLIGNKVTSNAELTQALIQWLDRTGTKPEETYDLAKKLKKGR